MSMSEVLARHHTSPLNDGGWYCYNCRVTLMTFGDAIAHQAEALETAGYGAIRKAQAEVLRDVVEDFSVNLTAMSGPRIRAWLSGRADNLAAGK